MKILVGGGSGYIGTRLVQELVELGYDVTVIDLCWFGNYLPENIKVIKKNLFDCKEKDLAGFDIFIFLAGLSNDPMAEFSPSLNFIYNSALPSYLAYIAKKVGIKKFIYASSCSVYGFTDDVIVDESFNPNSMYPYGISKLQGERGVLQLQDDDFSVVALRQGTVCGGSNRLRMDLIIHTMIKTALKEGKIYVNSIVKRPIFDIRDAVKAYILAIKNNVNGVFNVASVNTDTMEVALAIKDFIKNKENVDIEVINKNIPDKRNYEVSIEKAEKELGFIPQYKLSDTIENAYDFIKNIVDIEADRYYNIKIFSKLKL